MLDRFENLTTGVARIYKNIQKIKKHKMGSLGLKGTHVMCIFYLNLNPGGLTAADLCTRCREDKAGISRILSDLEAQGFITYDLAENRKKYRAKASLTEEGKSYAGKVNDLILQATLDGGQGISEEEREIFYRILFLIADNLDTVCANLDNQQKGAPYNYE